VQRQGEAGGSKHKYRHFMSYSRERKEKDEYEMLMHDENRITAKKRQKGKHRQASEAGHRQTHELVVSLFLLTHDDDEEGVVLRFTFHSIHTASISSLHFNRSIFDYECGGSPIRRVHMILINSMHLLWFQGIFVKRVNLVDQ
jgi:hypothetical protein